ncbi:hypothetical protein D3218_17870 [Aureimonas flava]|uniref:Uncharacterized protein n=1 Tax=Aureimonas flava TaxID=2320271 RepID=A0A3A1WFU1_9HYPH|nr:hypothetical protein [Aureimonas flava]RIX97952.1 hypothetical protein D3218_17870 [Aureimonas flava]
MSNLPETPERNAPDPILPEPIGEDALVQPDDGSSGEAAQPGAPGSGSGSAPPSPPPIADDRPTPGNQERPMTPEEELDEALDDTFPASDPIAPSRIDGPA